jgi:Ca-activated chloride channel family protein
MSESRLLIATLCGTVASYLMAQTPRVSIQPAATQWRAPKIENRPAQLRVDTNLVLVPVLVTDDADRLVTGLDKSDFKVYDNNVEQQISHFFLEDAPVSVVLVFDTSASMGRKLQTSRIAVGEFLKESNPEDEFALIEFANRPQVAVRFTDASEEIQNKLTFLESGGCTALVDAVILALDQMKYARHSRRAIVIVSDGGDNNSRYNERELKKRVREADVQIYSVAIVEPTTERSVTPEERDGPDLLNGIATQTGGRFFEVASPNALSDTGKRIGSALRHQYVLGYSPSTMPRDGRFHRITVKLHEAKGQAKLRASFRKSYLAPGH